MKSLYPSVAARAGHRCEYCRAPEAVFNLPFEVEHIIPSSRQGTDDESNLALACRACNLHKRNYMTGPDHLTQSEVRSYDPRRDQWNEHFDPDLETGELYGLTPIGRATVTRLQMNTSVQLEARRKWMRLRLFP